MGRQAATLGWQVRIMTKKGGMTKLIADDELDEWRNAIMGNFLFYLFKNMFVNERIYKNIT